MRQPWRQFWHARSARERTLIAAGTALLAAGCLIAWVWLPISSERERLALELPRRRAELQQMRADAAEIERLRSSAKKGAPDLAALLETQGTKAALAAQTAGRVTATFPKIGAQEWLAWAARLQMEHGVRIESVRIEPLGDTSDVKVVATLAGRD